LKSGKYNIGFIDLKVTINTRLPYNNCFDHQTYKSNCKVCYIEIKTNVKSIGSLIREINFYRSNISKRNRASFLVVTQTEGLAKLLNNQNIFVYNYQEDEN